MRSVHRNCPILMCVLLAVATPAAAEHFNIELKAARPDGTTQTAHSDQSPPEGGVNPRPVLRVSAGQTVTAQFMMTNVYPHGTIKQAEVRFYIVKEEQLGQKEVPSLKQGVVTQGHFTFDLKPKARVGTRIRCSIEEPGAYLLRVETDETKSDHEHFSAIDLNVQ